MRQMLRTYKGLPKNIFIMFFVKFINAFGDFVYPFLSLFLTIRLGYSAAFAAGVVTITVLMRIPGALFGGGLADRWNKKKAYLLCQSAAAICIILCAFLQEKHIVVVVLVMSTFFGSAVRPILNAFVYDLAEDQNRKEAYSLLYLGINVGVAIGPLLAGFLFNHYLTVFFLGDALTSLVAVGLVGFFVHVSPKVAKAEAERENKTFLDFIRFLRKKPALIVFFALNMVLSFMYAQCNFSVPLLLKEMFHKDSAVLFGTLMSVNAVTVVVATTFITYFTRKQSLLQNIALSGLFLGIGFGMITFHPAYWIFIPSTIVWTFGEILMSTNIGIYVVAQVDPELRTRSSAFQTIVSATGNSIGVFVMGLVITNFGTAYVWPVIFVMGILAFFGLRSLECSRHCQPEASRQKA